MHRLMTDLMQLTGSQAADLAENLHRHNTPRCIPARQADNAGMDAKGSEGKGGKDQAFPARAYIQRFDNVPPDYALVVEELKKRGIPVILKTTEEIVAKPWALTRDDLVVGNFDWTRLACKKLGITLNEPPDYPECLKHLLHRRVWSSTMGEVQKFLRDPENKAMQVFIKPAATAKAFAAIIEPKDQMLDTLISGIEGLLEGLPASTPVHCSELVDMVAEYRAYVVDGVIRAVCQYRGPRDSTEFAVDSEVVNKAVRTLVESDDGKDLAGCSVDFAVLKKKHEGKDVYVTALIEVNDGYSLGRYAGLSGKDYTDLLVARWARLVGKTKAAPKAAAKPTSTAVSAAVAAFPLRGFIQRFDNVPPDYALVVEELKKRGIPVILKTTEEITAKPWALTRDDLVVGNFDWTRLACKKLGITLNEPPDYPECLKHLLHRRVWSSTMGEVQKFLRDPENKAMQVFIKPAATAKAFAAIIEPKDQMLDTLISGIEGLLEGLPASTPVHCSELVDMVAEYRAYVVDGVIRAVCQYRGPKATPDFTLDKDVVHKAVQTLVESDEGKDLAGCSVDFAVIRKKHEGKDVYVTALIEVNDGYSLGRYAGLSGKDYTDLLIARWARLVGKSAASAKGASESKQESKSA